MICSGSNITSTNYVKLVHESFLSSDFWIDICQLHCLLSLVLKNYNFSFQISHFGSDRRQNWSAQDEEFVHSRTVPSDEMFVHGLYDLYSDMSGVSWGQIIEKDVVNDGQRKILRERTVPGDKIGQRSMTRAASLAKSVHSKKVIAAHLAVFNEDADQSGESVSADTSFECELIRGGSKSVSDEDPSEKVLSGLINFLCFVFCP